ADSGFVDDVILPEETRAKLIKSFASLEKKSEVLPKKKHGNIPL
ncbi:MAG: propionyl-CoA carboxylase beta chain, partial [Psychromonas sp.]